MANQRIDQLSTLNENTIASGDLIPVYDVSAADTKAITKTDFDQSIGEVVDSTFTITDNSDNTKKVKFQASGVTTGTTRTLTVPDSNTTIVGTDNVQTITNKVISPASNTIDGDILAIDYVPTNYTRTIVSETTALTQLTSHLDGINTALATVVTREFFIYPTLRQQQLSGTLGNFSTAIASSVQSFAFNFKVPDDFSALTECKCVVIPDTTETLLWDITTDFGKVGELYTTNSDSNSDSLAVTVNVITELPCDASLSGIEAGDYVGMIFNSDTSDIRTIGLLFKYTTI